MTKHSAAFLIAMIIFAPNADAALLRFDFSGLTYFVTNGVPTINGTYGGYFLLDSSVPDMDPDPDVALYDGSVVDGALTFRGVDYTISSGGQAQAGVINDGADRFGLAVEVVGDSGLIGRFLISLTDSSGTAFSDDSFPQALSLSMFDASDFGGGDDTLAALLIFDNGSLGTVDTAVLAPVPLPGALGFLFSSVLGLGLLGARRRPIFSTDASARHGGCGKSREAVAVSFWA